ncbi:MAG TPA: GyrI-like domain-containing protein [Sphingobacteriaceae bacterium]
MKRLIFFSVAIIAVLLLGIYLIIPGTVRQSVTVHPAAPETVVTRYLALKKGWAAWWPDGKGADPRDSSRFTYKGVRFSIVKNTYSAITIILSDGRTRIPSVITLVPGRNSGSEITWTFSYPAGDDPVSRLLGFRKSRKLAAVTEELLTRFRNFVEDEKEVYGVGIEYTKVRDSLVVVMRSMSDRYPTTLEVYEKVRKLQEFIGKNGISKDGYPMLNVSRTDDSRYRVMVAIPVRQRAKAPGNMEYSRLVLGNILTAEVRGGQASIDQALRQVRRFVEDRRHTSPAIPFQMMITDRLQEPDSSKWITRIYYPIL